MALVRSSLTLEEKKKIQTDVLSELTKIGMNPDMVFSYDLDNCDRIRKKCVERLKVKNSSVLAIPEYLILVITVIATFLSM